MNLEALETHEPLETSTVINFQKNVEALETDE